MENKVAHIPPGFTSECDKTHPFPRMYHLTTEGYVENVKYKQQRKKWEACSINEANRLGFFK